MKNYERLLVTLDLSKSSKATLQEAAMLCRQLNAEMLIVHVIDPRDLDEEERALAEDVSIYSDEFAKKRAELSKRRIDSLIRSCSAQDLKIKIVLRTGHPFSGVMDVIEKEKADLLVMGVKGRGQVEDFLVGSIAERIFRRSPIPVFSVRG